MSVKELIIRLENITDEGKDVTINYDIEEDYYVKEIDEDATFVYLKN